MMTICTCDIDLFLNGDETSIHSVHRFSTIVKFYRQLLSVGCPHENILHFFLPYVLPDNEIFTCYKVSKQHSPLCFLFSMGYYTAFLGGQMEFC